MNKKEKMKSEFKKLVELEEKLNKQFKTEHSLIRLGDKVGVKIPSIPTNLASVDNELIQTGGVPRGRIVEIFGPESSGKTTFSLHIIGCEQKQGGTCAFIDTEHALDPTWANRLGVDIDNLIVSQPDFAEQALETTVALVESGLVTLVVIDSVAGLIPRAELEGDIGDANIGLAARLMSQALRKLTGLCFSTGATVIFINQIREKIGVFFGSNETTAGGRALKHFASLRLDVRKIEAIKKSTEIIGQNIRLKAVKNKVGTPFRTAEIQLIYSTAEIKENVD